jgi:hypothetical protein
METNHNEFIPPTPEIHELDLIVHDRYLNDEAAKRAAQEYREAGTLYTTIGDAERDRMRKVRGYATVGDAERDKQRARETERDKSHLRPSELWPHNYDIIP